MAMFVSKHWKPQAVAVKRSRIRREPVRIEPAAPRRELSQAAVREREIRGGIAGVLLVTAALVAATVGISWATFSREDGAGAAKANQFGQCYNSAGPNCVVDGNTIYVGGERVEIAGIDAPHIEGARCAAERERGIDAAVRLAERLNKGAVSVSAARGSQARNVEVDGLDVGQWMINAGAARRAGDEPANWCG